MHPRSPPCPRPGKPPYQTVDFQVYSIKIEFRVPSFEMVSSFQFPVSGLREKIFGGAGAEACLISREPNKR
jgi:hypothetical protein